MTRRRPLPSPLPAAQQDGAVLGAIAIVTLACLGGFMMLSFQSRRSQAVQAALLAEQQAMSAHSANATSTEAGPQPLRRFGAFPRIQLTDARGQAFDSEQELAGKIVVVHFFFTMCPGSCPVMTKQLTDLQLVHEDPRVRFVSVTVDPERDTAEVLAAHQTKYSDKARIADTSRWRLLTGERKQLVELLRAAKQPTSDTALTDTGVIGHVDKFFLLDTEGELRGLYDYGDKGDMDALKDDITRLLAELASESSGGVALAENPLTEDGRVRVIIKGEVVVLPAGAEIAGRRVVVSDGQAKLVPIAPASEPASEAGK